MCHVTEWLQTNAELYHNMKYIKHSRFYYTWPLFSILYAYLLWKSIVNRCHVMWPSGSKPMPNCITRWANKTQHILLLLLFYMNIFIKIVQLFFNGLCVMWPSNFKPMPNYITTWQTWDQLFLLHLTAISFLYEYVLLKSSIYFLITCHVMWPSDSKPMPNYITTLDTKVTLLHLFYMNIYMKIQHFFSIASMSMWTSMEHLK